MLGTGYFAPAYFGRPYFGQPVDVEPEAPSGEAGSGGGGANKLSRSSSMWRSDRADRRRADREETLSAAERAIAAGQAQFVGIRRVDDAGPVSEFDPAAIIDAAFNEVFQKQGTANAFQTNAVDAETIDIAALELLTPSNVADPAPNIDASIFVEIGESAAPDDENLRLLLLFAV
jgi:hypothetical protein